MIDLTDSCFKSQDQEPCSLFQRPMHMGEMNTGNNRLMYECVCKRERVHVTNVYFSVLKI